VREQKAVGLSFMRLKPVLFDSSGQSAKADCNINPGFSVIENSAFYSTSPIAVGFSQLN
jgi:hypothetical protein